MKKIKLTEDVWIHLEKHDRYLLTIDNKGHEHKWRIKKGEDGGIEILHASTCSSSIAIYPYVSNQVELRPIE